MTTVHDVAAYLLKSLRKTTHTKLQQLVYYSQAWHLVWEGCPLFQEAILAWPNGPVVLELYEEYKGLFAVSQPLSGDPAALSNKESTSVDSVLSFYGHRESQWLSDLIHSEGPWRQARSREGYAVERGTEAIPLSDLTEYYKMLSQRHLTVERGMEKEKLKEAIGAGFASLEGMIDVDAAYDAVTVVAIKLGLGPEYGYETQEEQDAFLEGKKPSNYEPDPPPPSPELADLDDALDYIEAHPQEPVPAKDLCIWWIPRGDIYKVAKDSVGEIPGYLLERMTGLRTQGDLWIPPCIEFRGAVPKNPEKVDTTAHAGFMLYRRDLAKVAKFPGFVTDLNLQVIEPTPPPGVKCDPNDLDSIAEGLIRNTYGDPDASS